jgi:hypothetical protein
MAILESQIGFLRSQVRALQPPKDGRFSEELAEAVAVSLSLADRVRASARRLVDNSEAVKSLYLRWLEGAEEIIPLLRACKLAVEIEDRRRFMHTILEARAVVTRVEPCPTLHSVPLEEVGRALQHRS